MTFTPPVLVSPRSSSVWAVPVLVAIAFAILLASGENRQVFLLINSIGPQTSDELWANITILGDTTVALALCLPLWRRRPDLLWALVIGAACSTAWVHILKPLFEVPRPPAVLGDAVHVIGPAYRAGSFPSGHATTSFALAGLIVMAFGWRAASVAALVHRVRGGAIALGSRSALAAGCAGWRLRGLVVGFRRALAGSTHAGDRTQALGAIDRRGGSCGRLRGPGCGSEDRIPASSLVRASVGVLSLAVTAMLWWQDRRVDRRRNG